MNIPAYKQIRTLAGRMKGYEEATGRTLPINTPIILRIDGRAFHSLTRQFKSPFDNAFMEMMNDVGIALCKGIQNARIAYIQSDEISVLIYDKVESDVWFGNDVQKMTSISAALASTVATAYLFEKNYQNRKVMFDSRVFAIPEKDVTNYFIWRQKDWERNSIQMLARQHYSQAQLHQKRASAMHEMLHEKGVNWNDLETAWRRGRTVTRQSMLRVYQGKQIDSWAWAIDNEMPILTQNRGYIESIIREVNALDPEDIQT
jgi:tRNA(His) guanylyltransferase